MNAIWFAIYMEACFSYRGLSMMQSVREAIEPYDVHGGAWRLQEGEGRIRPLLPGHCQLMYGNFAFEMGGQYQYKTTQSSSRCRAACSDIESLLNPQAWLEQPILSQSLADSGGWLQSRSTHPIEGT